MKPRITINTNKDGELEIWLNPDGRDLFVRELQHLSERSDHFHLGPEDLGGEVPVQIIAYREGDQIIEWGKVLFRPDEWDAQHFPQVIAPESRSDG
ncbi:hypothetical protein [Stakelama marina]|uniref:Uncharacterized protein n=1 Tax=Stakelama marina TaxID=2826939 RepID=A0A8T4IBP7_9SPHN|nr:hypothetical protein [Stakelama marina]MBR0551522.1 hypothetical protein [Stakelama marina]